MVIYRFHYLSLKLSYFKQFFFQLFYSQMFLLRLCFKILINEMTSVYYKGSSLEEEVDQARGPPEI